MMKSTIKGAVRVLGYDISAISTAIPNVSSSKEFDIAIVGPYIKHNFGDDLIGAVFSAHLRDKDNLVSSIPGLSLENSQWIDTVPAYSVGKSVRAARAVLIGGGHIFGNRGPAPSNRYLWRAANAVSWAKLQRKPIIVNGVGAGPAQSTVASRLIRFICNSAHVVGVRDSESARFLHHEIGVPNEKLVVGSDVAFLWPKLLSVKPAPNGLIGLQCDPLRYTKTDERAQEKMLVEEFGKFAKENISDIAFVSNGARDTTAYRQANSLAPSLRYSSLQRFLPHLSGLRAIVTTHLHLSIAAFAARIPCFSIFVHDKTRRFYSQIGREERAVDINLATRADVRKVLHESLSARWSEQDEARLEEVRLSAQNLLDCCPLLNVRAQDRVLAEFREG